MDSIVKANDQGKIKIKKVTDNTAADVEIQVDLAPAFLRILQLMHYINLPIVKFQFLPMLV
jgi:hypothetical protein